MACLPACRLMPRAGRSAGARARSRRAKLNSCSGAAVLPLGRCSGSWRWRRKAFIKRRSPEVLAAVGIPPRQGSTGAGVRLFGIRGHSSRPLAGQHRHSKPGRRRPLLDCDVSRYRLHLEQPPPSLQPGWLLVPGGGSAVAAQSGWRCPDTRQSDPAGWLQAVLDGLSSSPAAMRSPGWPTGASSSWRWNARSTGGARAGEAGAGAMIDIDHFKRVNDATATLPATSAARRGPGAARMHPTDGHGGALRRRGVPR